MPDSGMCSIRRRKVRTEWTSQSVPTTAILQSWAPEPTKIFCINDECTYGDIPGLEFIRHTTLGTGGDRCDFYVREEA